MGELMYPLTGL